MSFMNIHALGSKHFFFFFAGSNMAGGMELFQQKFSV